MYPLGHLDWTCSRDYDRYRAKQVCSDTVYVDAPLRESGIDSLQAVQFTSELRAQPKQPVAATVLFDYPPMTAISAELSQSGSSGRARSHAATAAHAACALGPLTPPIPSTSAAS